MPLHLPDGAKTAVAITFDFDAHSAWMGAMNLFSPSYLSRGTFGAEVAVPRLIELLDRFEVPATWFTPGHDLVTWPAEIDAILDRGDEIGAHGAYHEHIPSLSAERERELMALQLEQHERIVGRRPRGYRSPAWDFSPVTLELLEESGFDYDSSLMDRDFELYHPRPVLETHLESANVFGEPSRLVEIPVSWYLDDWPSVEYVAGISPGLGDHRVMERRWVDLFDFAHEELDQAAYVLTMHPQTSGRGHHLMVLKRLLEKITATEGVRFATCSQLVDAWTEE